MNKPRRGMQSIYDMNREQFIGLLSTKCDPEDIWNWAPDIYPYLSGLMQERATDSVLREWAFEWASEQLNIKEDDIYDRWLGE